MESISGLIIKYLSWDYNGFHKQGKEVDGSGNKYFSHLTCLSLGCLNISPFKVNEFPLKSDTASDLAVIVNG